MQPMSPVKTPARGEIGAEAQLRNFIAKFAPGDQRLIRAVRSAMRKRLPSAEEMVYDNYNFFVIGYSPTDRPSDAILSITARAGSVGLCFTHGAKLDDPAGILRGSGNQTRSLHIDSAARLSDPEVEGLIAAAIAQGKPMPAGTRGALTIRSISAKQRPRRRDA
jgi:hypothetical protein